MRFVKARVSHVMVRAFTRNAPRVHMFTGNGSRKTKLPLRLLRCTENNQLLP